MHRNSKYNNNSDDDGKPDSTASEAPDIYDNLNSSFKSHLPLVQSLPKAQLIMFIY